jgi:hypothetical protein
MRVLKGQLTRLRKFVNINERDNLDLNSQYNDKIARIQNLLAQPTVTQQDQLDIQSLLNELDVIGGLSPKALATDIKATGVDQRNIQKIKQEIEDRINKTHVKGPPPLGPRARLPQLEKERLKLREAKEELRRLIESHKPFKRADFIRNGLTPGQATLAAIKAQAPHWARLPVTLNATADMSYMFRQGLWLSTRSWNDAERGKLAVGAAGKAWEAFWNQHDAHEIDLALRRHPNHLMRLKYGLYLAPMEIGSVSAQEEIFANELGKRIPGYRHVIGASERHMVTGLNLLRAGVFDQFVKDNPNASEEEYRAMADYINKASGRGKFTGTTAKSMAVWFFAPRFAVSRFQTPYTLYQYWNLPTVRKEIARDMASTTATGLSVLALGALAGAVVGLDPRDSDFGKMVIGNTRIDPWGGFLQPARLLTGIGTGVLDRTGLTGKHLPENMKAFTGISSIWDMAANFTFYKLAPAVNVPFTLLSGENVVGEKQGFTETGLRTVTPLFLQEVFDAYQTDGIRGGTLSGPMAFVGVGVSSYGDALKRGDVKQSLRRAGYRPRRPVYPKWIQDDPDRKKQADEAFATKFVQKMDARAGALEKLDGAKLKTQLEYLAAQSRWEINLGYGKVGRYPKPKVAIPKP